MNKPVPTSIERYLAAVRDALGDADPALVQDALYDAEEYLRSELAENPGLDEPAVVARVASSYGAPDEVADIYRETEVKVARALRTPPAPPRRSLAGRFFGVIADPRAYAGLFYMVLALATGIAYFTVAVTGMSLSVGLAILIIGVPFIVLFVGIVRLLSLVEGRIVETLLGVRMPRRPLYSDRGKPVLERIKAMFVDPRTWSTLLYMVLMLPLGIAYFTLVVTGLAVGVSFTLAPIAYIFLERGLITIDGHFSYGIPYLHPALGLPLMFVLGVLIVFGMLHLARGVATLHGALAKNLLVKSAQY
jgi:hypothetical protein